MDAILRTYLGESIRAARLRKGLTQAQAARRTRLATTVYGRIERGQMMPSVSTLLRLCRALDVEPNTLLGFLSPSPPPWFTGAGPRSNPAAVRRVLRVAHQLRHRQLSALGTVARAMLDSVVVREPRGASPP